MLHLMFLLMAFLSESEYFWLHGSCLRWRFLLFAFPGMMKDPGGLFSTILAVLATDPAVLSDVSRTRHMIYLLNTEISYSFSSRRVRIFLLLHVKACACMCIVQLKIFKCRGKKPIGTFH